MKFLFNSKVANGVNNKEKGVIINLTDAVSGAASKIETDVALISIGRRPFTGGLQLEKAGLKTNERGVLEINKHWQTTVPHIYAIGDVTTGPMLAHKAEEEGIAAVEYILGEGGHVNYDAIPAVIYTDPEVASVGKTEEELKAAKINYKKGVFPFQANSRARTNMEPDGLIKILTDAETDKLLGCHVVGVNAGELIAEGVLAMEYGGSAEDIGRTCHAHPTLSEAFKEACMAAYDKPIHF